MKFISLLGAVAIVSCSSIVSAFISPTSKSTHQLTTSNHQLTSLNVNARGSGYGSPLENISEGEYLACTYVSNSLICVALLYVYFDAHL